MFEHKAYGMSIKVNWKIDDSLFKLIEQSKVCLEHGMAYVIEGIYYRKYKRGKNRCQRCGVKLPSELPELT